MASHKPVPMPAMVTIEESLREKRLEGKRIILTGTTQGVGEIAQELLCAHGAFVIGSGRTPGKAAANAQRLKDKGYKAEGFDVDLSIYDQAEAWVEKSAEIMGGIDVVINNASKPDPAMMADLTPEKWRNNIANELDLVYNVCHAAWPHLIKAGTGTIIGVSSGNGFVGMGNTPQTAHAATKAGVTGLMRQLAAEGARFGIRANALSPGLIETPALDTAPAPMLEFLQNWAVLNHPINPLDIAYGLLFLASDESRFITGADIPVDGGTSRVTSGPVLD